MIVAVVLVIDNPNVRPIQLLNDRDLVFRLTKPAAVIVQGDLAAHFGGRFRDRSNASRLGNDPLFLFLL